jgi:acyl-CoA synthetase (AMP-forming)/AMP-acid ligase II
VGDNCLGEIAVSGSCLFSGYYQQPEETGKKLQAGWYFTGDLGFCSQGHLVITGRKHDLIIVHGRNFYAHEMEFAVNQLPGVKPGRVVATGYYLPEIGSEEMVIIAEAENRSVSAENLKTEIKQCLLDTSGLLPYDVRIVPPGWLVKTTSGKISRGANLEKYLSEAMALSR